MTISLDRLQAGPLPIFRHTHETLVSFSSRREQIGAREIANEILADPFATAARPDAMRNICRHGREVLLFS